MALTCLLLSPLANSWAQDTRNAREPKIISKEEAAKKYPPPNGKSYPPGSDLTVLNGGASGGGSAEDSKTVRSERTSGTARPSGPGTETVRTQSRILSGRNISSHALMGRSTPGPRHRFAAALR